MLEMQPFAVIRDRGIGAASSLKIDVYCYYISLDDATQMVYRTICAKIGSSELP